jgi:phosphatidylglycerol:prolipoprotein diacylglycerol transferase
VGGLIGARLFHVLDHLDHYGANPLETVLFWQGGMAAYGGFVGGIVAGVIYSMRHGLSVWRVLDAAAPAMIVGQIIGRCGCLANGDAWGAPTDCSCGVVYTHPRAALPTDLIGVPTHPYPLYEMVALLAMMLLLRQYEHRLGSQGRLFLLTVIGYAAARFVLTTVRQEPTVLLGFQEAQVPSRLPTAK